MEIEFPKPTEVLGRIAAQTAKQVIFQKVREAERENIFAEYNERIGEVVNGTVKRFENGDIISSSAASRRCCRARSSRAPRATRPATASAPSSARVNRSAKGPQIVLSRTDPALLIKLFEQEVPGDLRRHGASSRAPCARRATAPRWPSTRASATSTRSAPASA